MLTTPQLATLKTFLTTDATMLAFPNTPDGDSLGECFEPTRVARVYRVAYQYSGE